jgi:hypothetical protein
MGADAGVALMARQRRAGGARLSTPVDIYPRCSARVLGLDRATQGRLCGSEVPLIEVLDENLIDHLGAGKLIQKLLRAMIE